MSLVEQTRDRADSIPGGCPEEGDRISYRESISNHESATTQDKHQLDATVVELETVDSNDDDNHSNTSEETKSITSTASTTSEADDEMLSVRSLSNTSSTTDLAIPTANGDAPALPAKSNLRASRLLASIPQKKTANDDQPILPHAAPHQIYLSSEEDASSSADDFSDFEESDIESSSSQKSRTPRRSHEDTARLVSVVFYGKPSIVNLSRRPISAGSSESVKGPAAAGILRTATEPTLSRPRSISSSSTATTSTRNHPPRSSSMLTGGEIDKKNRPQFLTIDPCAASKADGSEGARTPKTPTGMFRKTLSLVKKRSRSTLVQSESSISHMEQVGEEDEETTEVPAPRQSTVMDQSLSYQDIMKAAKMNAAAAAATPRSEFPPPPPTPMSPKNRFRAGLSLGRQKSVRV